MYIIISRFHASVTIKRRHNNHTLFVPHKRKKIFRYNDIYVVITTYYVVITTYDGCRYNDILYRYNDILSRYNNIPRMSL